VAYQLEGPGGCDASRCFSLGSGSAVASVIVGKDGKSANGIALTYSGGDRSREFTFNIECDASAPVSSAPTAIDGKGSGLHYSTHFKSPAGCGAIVAGQCPPQPPTPPPPSPGGGGWLPPDQMARPTAAQLEWQAAEIGAIGHFNMGTFQACGIGDTLLEPGPSTGLGGVRTLFTSGNLQ
jgi:hypothetical protein